MRPGEVLNRDEVVAQSVIMRGFVETKTPKQ